MYFRVYAEVVHVKSEYLGLLSDGLNPKYGYHRDAEVVAKFLRDFYDEAGVPPQLVEYVEAFGAGELIDAYVYIFFGVIYFRKVFL